MWGQALVDLLRLVQHVPLVLLRFSGTISDWLELERTDRASQAGNSVIDLSATTIADREALSYHRAVPGFGLNDYYVLKPTPDTLLWILTDAAYRPLIDYPAIQPS